MLIFTSKDLDSSSYIIHISSLLMALIDSITRNKYILCINMYLFRVVNKYCLYSLNTYYRLCAMSIDIATAHCIHINTYSLECPVKFTYEYDFLFKQQKTTNISIKMNRA